MTGNKDHINYTSEDIRRYWNGQLSPAEMHAMEKAALDDPFLSDALEGMGEAIHQYEEPEIVSQLDTLHRQVAERTAKRSAPVISLRWWKAAAVAVVVLTVGFWIFTTKEEKEESPLAQQESAAENKVLAPAPVTDSAVPAAPPASAANDALKDKASNQADVTAGVGSFTDSAGQIVAKNSRSRAEQPAERGLAYFNTKVPPKTIDTIYVLPGKQAPRSMTLTADVKEIKKADTLPQTYAFANIDEKKPATEVVRLNEEQLERLADKKLENAARQQNVISGVVTDVQNNPLGNASLRLDNRDSYFTDPRGNFKIPVNVTDSLVNVSVSIPGYPAQQFTLRNNFNGAGNVADNQLRMQTTNKVENEVVVGYGSQRKKDLTGSTPVSKVTVQDAQPAYGWLSYDQYLEKNKRIPETTPKLSGEVVISFFVNKKGELTGFRIEKPLSPPYDAEALRLIREGPPWKLIKGRKSRATVIVRF